MAEVKKRLGSKNFYLTIINLLNAGLNPSKICLRLDISKQRLNYYMSSLKKQGIVTKIGYGVYEVKEVKEVKKRLTDSTPRLADLKPDQVRGHGIQFKLSIPKDLKNWNRRKEFLTNNNIKFKDMPNIFGGGELLNYMGKKIILTNKSIIVNEPKSYFAETSKESKSTAIYEFLLFVRSLEKHLKAKFNYGTEYKFKITRQHYALVKNALAKQYNREGQKLEVSYLGEQWFVIDDSLNLDEAETVHPKTADTDNKKVQDFFNGVKKFEKFTPDFIVNAIGQNAQNLDYYAKHLNSHIESVQILGSQTKRLVDEISKLSKVINKKDL